MTPSHPPKPPRKPDFYAELFRKFILIPGILLLFLLLFFDIIVPFQLLHYLVLLYGIVFSLEAAWHHKKGDAIFGGVYLIVVSLLLWLSALL